MPKDLPNGKNMGGFGAKFYMVDIDDVLTFPTLPTDTLATMDDALVCQTALVLKAGKSLSEIYGTPSTVGMTEADQGEKDGISQKPIFKFFHPGGTARVKAFTMFTNNRSFLAIAQDAEMRWVLIGSEQYPLTKSASDGHNTGEKAEDRKGTSFQFEMDGSHGPNPIIAEALIPFPESSGSGS